MFHLSGIPLRRTDFFSLNGQLFLERIELNVGSNLIKRISLYSGADQEVRHSITEESVFFIKGNNVFTINSISNFAVLLDPRMLLSGHLFKTGSYLLE